MATAQPSGHAPARRVIVTVTIGSFSVAALLGVLALLGGDFGDTQVRVLLTTLTVGVVSIAVLCYLSTAGTPFQIVGVLGGVTVLVPLTTALLMIWVSESDNRYDEAVLEAFGVGAIVAGTLAQACLLLVLAHRKSPVVRVLLALTLVVAGLLAAILSALVLGGAPDEDYMARLTGVVAILDVLGTVVVAALAKFGAGPGWRREGLAPGGHGGRAGPWCCCQRPLARRLHRGSHRPLPPPDRIMTGLPGNQVEGPAHPSLRSHRVEGTRGLLLRFEHEC